MFTIHTLFVALYQMLDKIWVGVMVDIVTAQLYRTPDVDLDP